MKTPCERPFAMGKIPTFALATLCFQAAQALSSQSTNTQTSISATCDVSQPRQSQIPTGDNLKQALAVKNTDSTCNGIFPPGSSTISTYNHWSMILNITRSDPNAALNNCLDDFNSIIDQCMVQKNFWGGTVVDNEGVLTYAIYNSAYPSNGLSPYDAGGPSQSSGSTTLKTTASSSSGSSATQSQSTPASNSATATSSGSVSSNTVGPGTSSSLSSPASVSGGSGTLSTSLLTSGSLTATLSASTNPSSQGSSSPAGTSDSAAIPTGSSSSQPAGETVVVETNSAGSPITGTVSHTMVNSCSQ